jgi:endonuclease-3
LENKNAKTELKKVSKREAQKIKNLFLQHYPESKTELIYRSVYELLVAVMLSAQCTDKRVNLITPALFEKYPDIKSLANANIEDVKELIKSCSFFNNKAKNLISMAKKVESEFGGEIPLNRDDLMSLDGVGQKTANVVMIETQNANFMAVDTHVFRVSHRLGLSLAKSVKDTERDLEAIFEDNLAKLHQGMVLFGRYICKAKNPECKECFLNSFCQTKKTFKAK